MLRKIFVIFMMLTVFVPGYSQAGFDEKKGVALAGAISRFRTLMLEDAAKAFALYSNDEALKRIQALNRGIFVSDDTGPLWSLFIGFSSVIIGGENGDQPVVAFYNPWADVILITAWQYDAGRPRIFDAEMAPAEVVRSGLENFDLVPQWKKSNQYRPEAVGEAVADTVLAFERLFPPSSAITGWREKLCYLKRGPDFLDGLYAAAGLMLQGWFQTMDLLYTPEADQNPLLKSSRAGVDSFLRAGLEKNLDPLLASATDTLPVTSQALKDMAGDGFGLLKVADLALGREMCQVFLAPMDGRAMTVSLLFERTKENVRLRRVDIIDFNTFYLLRKQKGGQS